MEEQAVELGGEGGALAWSRNRLGFSTSTSNSCMALSKVLGCLMEPPRFLSSYLPRDESTTC